MKLIVVRQGQFWGGGRILCTAALHMFFVNLLMRLVFVTPLLPPVSGYRVYYVSMILAIALLTAPPIYVRYERLQGSSMIVYAFLSVVAFLAWRTIAHILLVEYGIKIPLLSRDGIKYYWHLQIDTAPLTVFLSVCVGWLLGRAKKGKLVVQDGYTCFGCGYDLHGNENRICPECGRGYSLHELGRADQGPEPEKASGVEESKGPGYCG